MFNYFKRTVSDILLNRFLNVVTIVTISLSILVVATFVLFFENASRVIDSWNQGLRIVAYLEKEFKPSMLPGLTDTIMAMDGSVEVRFIPKEEALLKLKQEMGRSAFLETLEDNPLPHAIEIKMKRSNLAWNDISAFAGAVEKLPQVQDVEYGQRWLGRFLVLFTLFRIIGYAMSGLFFMIALFITANTVRLALYARQEEVLIMRLVGATDSFITTPFHIQGLIQGILGGILGLFMLLIFFFLLSSNLGGAIASNLLFDIQFLSIKYCVIIIFGSALLGWLGCYLSLKQFLKY